jgi:hypothetical protein
VRLLIEALRETAIPVEHSPLDSTAGWDPRWADWYEIGLPTALRRSQLFVIGLEADWHASTWMGEEAHMATEMPDVIPPLEAFYWNPEGIALPTGGMAVYLRNELPREVAATVSFLRSAGRRTMR